MLSFALKTLFHDRGKMTIAVVGVVFSLVLVNVQGGLFLGTMRKAVVLIERGGADIWVGHRGTNNPDIAADIPESWISRIRSIAGVDAAESYIIAGSHMKFPNGDTEAALVIGCDRTSFLGCRGEFLHGSAADLRKPNAISIDALDAPRLGNLQVGDVVELNGKRASVACQTKGLLGFITTPYVFTTLDSAREYTGVRPDRCSFILVQAAEGTDVSALCSLIRNRVPEADAFTSEEFSANAVLYWVMRTGIGMSFGGSTLLGVFVGLLMVAQSLYAFVLDHLDDYATLKAIGAEESQVCRVLIVQGLAVAAMGIAIGSLISHLIHRYLSSPLMPIEIPFWLWLTGIVMVTCLCLISSMLPFGRIRRVDPVAVLQV